MFRRPKKPTRPRVITTESEAGDEDDDFSPPLPQQVTDTLVVKETRKLLLRQNEEKVSNSKKPSLLLSFDDEFREDDGEEIFRVKKSSVSRRLMKQRDREKKDTRKSPNHVVKSESKLPDQNSSNKNNVPSIPQPKAIENPNPIPEVGKKDEYFVRILNGREAEAIDMESGSEDDESGGHEYSKRGARGNRDALSDTLRRTLEQAQIPDANLVHEVRKRRQMARTQEAPVFIPVSNNSDRSRIQKSTLVREDDENDHSDDDEDDRLDFSVVRNMANIDREKRQEVFNAAQEETIQSDGDSEMEMDEWESQQLRKGVSKSQIHHLAKEALQHKDFMRGQQAPDVGSYTSNYPEYSPMPETNTTNSSSFPYRTQSAEYSVDNIMNGVHKLNPELILTKLNKRLEDLIISRNEGEREISGLNADLEIVRSELVETTTAVPVLSSRFTLYQKLRGYVTDLVDCLRCKVPIIKSLEHRMTHLLKTRLEHLTERRRQDVRDQLEEVNSLLNATATLVVSPAPGEVRVRRAAEREGRRTRRRRLREIKGVCTHKDGLSSDDEETELETATFKAQKEQILRDSLLVFEDVNAEFASLEDVLSRFKEWRDTDLSSYQESYTNLCIPKLIAPYIRLSILGWDPLSDDADLTNFEWIQTLLTYGFVKNETAQTLILDPDSRAVPLTIEKVLLPWLESLVKVTWDPTSGRDTRKLVNLVMKLVNDWSLGPNSKTMHSLMCTIISKFKDTVDNDVFIPIFPKSAVTNKCTPASVYSARQFWFSVKILENISVWSGLLSDKPLQILALDALLTRYILLGVRTGIDLADSAEKANMIVTVLPSSWLSPDSNGELPNGIQQLIRCLVFVVQSSDCSLAANRSAVPEIGRILKTVGAANESQAVLKKYA